MTAAKTISIIEFQENVFCTVCMIFEYKKPDSKIHLNINCKTYQNIKIEIHSLSNDHVTNEIVMINGTFRTNTN